MFKDLNDGQSKRFQYSLIGHDTAIRQEVDMFEGLTENDELYAVIDTFTGSQKVAFQYCRKLPNGGLVQRPLGKSKSYFLTQVIYMDVALSIRLGRKIEILVTAPSNTATNKIGDSFRKQYPQFNSFSLEETKRWKPKI